MAPRSKRKDQEPAAEQGDAYEPPRSQAGTEAGDPFPPVEQTVAAAGIWEGRVARPNPFDSVGYYWKGGYGIRYQENDRRRWAEIRFGDGSAKDKPLNFDKIRDHLMAKGLSFKFEDRAWVIEFNRDTHGDVSDHVKAVLRDVVKLEEEMRGPRTSERTGEPEIQR
jgi:hypothetical protein